MNTCQIGCPACNEFELFRIDHIFDRELAKQSKTIWQSLHDNYFKQHDLSWELTKADKALEESWEKNR